MTFLYFNVKMDYDGGLIFIVALHSQKYELPSKANTHFFYFESQQAGNGMVYFDWEWGKEGLPSCKSASQISESILIHTPGGNKSSCLHNFPFSLPKVI